MDESVIACNVPQWLTVSRHSFVSHFGEKHLLNDNVCNNTVLLYEK